MRLAWVTNDRYYSGLLRFLFNEPTSHVGSIFSLYGMSLAVDINRPYGKVYDLTHWLSKYTIIWEMRINFERHDELKLYQAAKDYAVLRPYDMRSYYYGMFAGIGHKFFGIPYPKTNALASGTASMCQEILTPILQHPTFKAVVPHNIDVQHFSECTPHMSMLLLKDATANNPSVEWAYNG